MPHPNGNGLIVPAGSHINGSHDLDRRTPGIFIQCVRGGTDPQQQSYLLYQLEHGIFPVIASRREVIALQLVKLFYESGISQKY